MFIAVAVLLFFLICISLSLDIVWEFASEFFFEIFCDLLAQIWELGQMDRHSPRRRLEAYKQMERSQLACIQNDKRGDGPILQHINFLANRGGQDEMPNEMLIIATMTLPVLWLFGFVIKIWYF